MTRLKAKTHQKDSTRLDQSEGPAGCLSPPTQTAVLPCGLSCVCDHFQFVTYTITDLRVFCFCVPCNHVSHKFKTYSRIKRLAPEHGRSAGSPHHRVEKTVIIWRNRSSTSVDTASASHKSFGFFLLCGKGKQLFALSARRRPVAYFSFSPPLNFPPGERLHQPQPHPARPRMQSDGQRHPLHAGDAADRLPDHRLSRARQPHGSAHQLCESGRTCLQTSQRSASCDFGKRCANLHS